MWLDYQDSTGKVPYWVETGLESYAATQYGTEYLFWADSRPNGGGYAFHTGSFLDNSDFGKYSTETITKIASDQFSVNIGGLPVASLAGTSTHNPINPNLIQIGLEMCGSSGASGPINGYAYNQWNDSHGWHYQTNNGNQNANHDQLYPAKGYWKYYPTQSSTGGQWVSCVQGNGC